jgi:hypothetical protein
VADVVVVYATEGQVRGVVGAYWGNQDKFNEVNGFE